MAASLSDFDLPALEATLAGWGFPSVHAGRLLRWHLAGGPGAGPDPGAGGPQSLPEALVRRLEGMGWADRPSRTVASPVAADGTTKLLLRLADGRTVESVLLPEYRSDRAAGCLSSQVGCAMGCDFCATARGGFERNLTAGEIVDQFVALRRCAAGQGRRLRTVVFMGMGEPLLNLEAVVAAVRRMADNRMGGLGWRQITVSTVGLVPGIEALTATGLNVQLAVSLHAPDDLTRARLLPPGRRFPIREILEAADRFQASRGRPVILQYCLLAGVNDAPGHARALAGWLKGRRMHVNLLRYNPTGPGPLGVAYQPSDPCVEAAFAEVLRGCGVVAHVRRSRGPEIDAACGQLRARHGGRGGGV